MATIDHSILIPRPAQFIWEHIGDVSRNPTWQADCATVSILTTRRAGPGTRWRYTTKGGRELIVEITAWYDGLGYEYTFVDGTPFRKSTGRLRLQETAEGTIVQWTFSYEMGGVLGGMRDSLGAKRQIEAVMVDSLKSLWRAMAQAKTTELSYESKSVMRDAPNYEARSQYKPRHPSKVKEANAAPPITGLAEPPITEEDTRPRQPAAAPEPPAPRPVEPALEVRSTSRRPSRFETSPAEPEPSFLAALPPLESETPASQVRPPADEPSPFASFMRPSAVEPPAIEPARATRESAVIEPLPSRVPTEPLPILSQAQSGSDEMPAVKIEEPQPAAAAEVGRVIETEPPTSVTTTKSDEPVKLATATQERAKADTGEVSVFDVFGLPKPSQTQEMRAVQLQGQAAVGTASMVVPSRIGLRLALRRKRVKLRRPG
jgi:uncharacterized membrane protein